MVRDGGTLFRKVAPGSASSYITLAPSEPELELTEAGSLRLLHAAPRCRCRERQRSRCCWPASRRS